MKTVRTDLITETSRLPIVKDVIDHLQEAISETIKELAVTLNSGNNTSFILYGCINSGSGTNYNISAGAVFHNGEILIFPGYVGSNAGTPYFSIVETYSAADPLYYSDGVYKNTNLIKTCTINFVSGFAGFSSLGRLSSVAQLRSDVIADIATLTNNTNEALATKSAIAQPGFTNLSLINGAIQTPGSDVAFPSYMVSTIGTVHFRGEVRMSGSGEPIIIANLPVEARPGSNLYFWGIHAQSNGNYLAVKNGTITVLPGTNTDYNLEMIAPYFAGL